MFNQDRVIEKGTHLNFNLFIVEAEGPTFVVLNLAPFSHTFFWWDLDVPFQVVNLDITFKCFYLAIINIQAGHRIQTTSMCFLNYRFSL